MVTSMTLSYNGRADRREAELNENKATDLSPPVAILWDWDNTLVDGWAGVTAALNVVFAAHDMPAWTAEDTRARARLSMQESFAALFGDRARDAGMLFRTSFAQTHLDHLRPMPGAEAALAAGKRWPQGVVSNKDGPFLRLEVAHLGWGGSFATVIGAGDAAADKPRPEPIWAACQAVMMNPSSRVWYIGDTALDMHAAHAAGCTAVLLGDGGHDGGMAAFQERGFVPDLCFADGFALAASLAAAEAKMSGA
jgi:phosphoglycolate phosphatase